MEIYDPIHGLIEIDETAKKIIDTVEFQRLRNIKQLGCCYYVFPGSSHNRFEHSLGVYHLTKLYIECLGKDYFTEKEYRCLTIAGLIHDIGHGPYSHLFDGLVSKEKNHEYRSGKLLEIMNDKYFLGFDTEDLDFIKKVIYPKNITHEKKYLFQIVSNKNGIDVDRFDYIIRDVTMTGLNYGIEYLRIMKKSKIIDNEICYSDSSRINIDDFFKTRYTLYREIYNHHTVRAIEHMMCDFLQKLDPYISIKDIVENDNFEKFITLTDSITDCVYYIPNIDKEIKTLVNRIKQRDIYQYIGEIVSPDKIVFDCKKENDTIIDEVKIEYKGSEMCKYYQKKVSIGRSSCDFQKEIRYMIYNKEKVAKEKIDSIMEDIVADYSSKSSTSSTSS